MSLIHEVTVSFRSQHLGQFDKTENFSGRATVYRTPQQMIQFKRDGLIVFEIKASDLEQIADLYQRKQLPI